MELIIKPKGDVRCIYGEAIPLQHLGQISIRRGSHVEPNGSGGWCADMSPVKGPLLGPFETRSAALAAEVDWLTRNWLTQEDLTQDCPTQEGLTQDCLKQAEQDGLDSVTSTPPI
jgi:hypothetical protein